LKYLDCRDTNITEIPDIPGLDLHCNGCRSLTKIPHITGNICCNGCPWLPQNGEFEKNLKRLVFLQKAIKRYNARKKLEKIIPLITEIYYSPGCKGFELARRSYLSNIVK
jgi:hypothetical protein